MGIKLTTGMKKIICRIQKYKVNYKLLEISSSWVKNQPISIYQALLHQAVCRLLSTNTKVWSSSELIRLERQVLYYHIFTQQKPLIYKHFYVLVSPSRNTSHCPLKLFAILSSAHKDAQTSPWQLTLEASQDLKWV